MFSLAHAAGCECGAGWSREWVELEFVVEEKFGADFDVFVGVDLQQPDRGFANGRSPHDSRAFQLKVVFSTIGPGVEDSDHAACGGIECCQVRALMPIAVWTGQREILGRIVREVLPGDDVLDVKRQIGSGRLRKPAILATIASPSAHKLSGGSVHARSGAEQAAGSGLHDGDEVKCGQIAIVVGTFVF